MKYLLLIIMLSFTLNAKEVILKINHYANGEKLEIGEKIFNVNGTEIKLKRLEYYLSNFLLIDENNNEYAVMNNYQFVNVKYDEYTLGNSEIENISKLVFHFGIDSITNHSDPANYPEFSPLYIVGKDNHWGWAAGYKFVMLEGFAKDIYGTFKNNFNYHLFGDEYFTKLELTPEVEIIDDKFYINLDFNLEELVNNVDLTQNNQLHGSGGPNDIIGGNIKNGIVFKSDVASVENILPELKISPNPSSDFININYENSNLNGLEITINNILGIKLLKFNPLEKNKLDVSNFTKGIYFLNVSKNGEVIKTLKFIKK